MAQRITTQLIDDIDGSVLDAGEGDTILFSLEGVTYEIDLSNANAAALREALAPYVTRGRRVRIAGGRTASAVVARAGRGQELAKVREWAAANGFKVADRGRVPESVMAAYNDAA